MKAWNKHLAELAAKRKERVASIQKLSAAGLAFSEIAKRFGLTTSYLRGFCRQQGIASELCAKCGKTSSEAPHLGGLADQTHKFEPQILQGRKQKPRL